ncbi:MAG: Uma2 family endonuclease [Pyrinomonadaceae bacterium]
MSAELIKYRFSADEYQRIGEAGIFPPDARLELIEGEIFEMPRVSPPHAGTVCYLGRLLHRNDKKWLVSRHHPVRLNDFSEPLPDLALLRWRDDYYRHAHPSPADVLLLIEVADTTVVTDRKVKLPLYARAGIAEAWLVNIPDERVEVYSNPAGSTYQRAEVFGRGDDARSQTVEGLFVNVSELLG